MSFVSYEWDPLTKGTWWYQFCLQIEPLATQGSLWTYGKVASLVKTVEYLVLPIDAVIKSP